MAEKCVRNAHNKFEAESHSRREVEKTLGTLKKEKTQLAEELKVSKNKLFSATAGLKNAEAQLEDQRKLLYKTELNLATEKVTVLSLRAKLQKAKKAVKVAKETVKAAEEAAYERGVEERKKCWPRR